MRMTVPFGNWVPDQAADKSPGVTAAQDVVPAGRGYIPLRALSVVSTAGLTTTVLGTLFARSSGNADFLYAGTASKLWEAASSATPTYSDESKAGGYTTASGERWEFANFDRNYKVIATNYTDPVQSITTGGGGAGAFADMITSTNKPKARHIAIIGQFVVLGNTNDTTDGVRVNRVWWSAFGDQTNFDPDAATQCDYEDLSTGGPIERIVSGTEYGLIFQRDMVRVMRYVGGSQIFSFEPINYVPGTPYGQTVVSYAGRVFYISNAGVIMLEGVSPVPIGAQQVDRDIMNVVATSVSSMWTATAAIDPLQKLVAFGLPVGSNSTPQHVWVYKWDTGQWAWWKNQLIDILCYVDPATWYLGFGAFDTSTHKLAVYSGAAKTGTITTSDIQPVVGQRWQLNTVRPLLELYPSDANATPNITVSAAGRRSLWNRVSYGANLGMASSLSPDGLCNFRVSGHYQRLQTSLSVSWFANVQPPHITGLELDFELEGER